MSALSARERVILAIDTDNNKQAHELGVVAREVGAKTVKLGVELATAESWLFCARLAGQYGLDWVADAALHARPETVASAVRTFGNLVYPPVAVTMHTSAGAEAMHAAQEAAGSIKVFGDTVHTSLDARQAADMYHTTVERKVVEFGHDAIYAGLAGVVCSAPEVGNIKAISGRELLTMVPGARSAEGAYGSLARAMTPAEAVRAGADWLVIGGQITQAEDPAAAFEAVVAEIETVQ